MARLEDLISQIGDHALRRQIESALAGLKRRQRFGLVFEEHIPEVTALDGQPVQVGSLVVRRDDRTRAIYRATAVSADGSVVVDPTDGGETQTLAASDLLVVKRFGEPIYPALTPVGDIRRGPNERPVHAVISGENFHALQLLVYLFEGKVDCIYIDPPYNTGARDWMYNNRYIDDSDAWKHSKWLSFMEKRLRLSRRLLSPDGVLIVTIDEHEVHHLGMLIERLFPEYLRYMVTAVINPKGTFKLNFGRVDEQLLFVVPSTGKSVIVPKPVGPAEKGEDDDAADRLIRKLVEFGPFDAATLTGDLGGLESDEQERLTAAFEAERDEPGSGVGDEDADTGDASEPALAEYEDWFLRRRGQESSYRHQRPNQFYAIIVDEKAKKVLGVGPPLGKDEPYKTERRRGVTTVFPVDNEGNERVWRYSRDTMQRYIDGGEILVGTLNKKTKTWTLNHRKLKKGVRRHKTVWWEKRHDAGVHGTNVLNNLLGRRGLFPFPKSVYAVQDALASVVRNRPDAIILDFFAGSGTTLHATCLLNAEDGGRRRSILVTNNEVSESEAAKLNERGLYRGDPEYDSQGIFELVTRPRCEAAVSGRRPDGTPVPGAHIGGRSFRDGFDESIEFYRLDYLDPDEVDLGRQFDAILPALWVASGGIGTRPGPGPQTGFLMPQGSTYGVLFREAKFREFVRALARRSDVTRVWLVTDSEEAFAEMCAALPSTISVSMLYRDYLRNFRINTESNL